MEILNSSNTDVKPPPHTEMIKEPDTNLCSRNGGFVGSSFQDIEKNL
jgi:hypothetical protein